MPNATATVTTPKPAPYMKQLCRHFGHRSDARFDDERGHIAFAWGGTCDLEVAGPDTLVIRAEAADAEQLERVTRVVGDHLERFGRRDGLSVSWT